MSQQSLFKLAWNVVPKLPVSFVEGVAGVVGNVVWALNVPSVKQLRRNYQQFLGSQVEERTVRRGVKSYFRCFAEQFSLPGWSAARIRGSLSYPGAEQIAGLMDDGPVVLALTHSGNWDMAGAWFSQEWAPVITVAEKLEPIELYNDFVSVREDLGMTILGVGKGEHIFEKLVEATRGQSALVPLLADRDISGHGVEVQLGAGKALVAAGPAALALRLQRPLIAGHLYYERQDGKWVVHADFTEPIEMPEPAEGETAVEALTRAWVSELVPRIKHHLVDWHMMQKLFVTDLDPERLARARRKARQ